MLNLAFDDALLLIEEWESEDLLPVLKERHGSWLRGDIHRVKLEGGAWGVGLVVTYSDGREFRELLDLIEEDSVIPGFCIEEGPVWNAERFKSLSPDALHCHFAGALFVNSTSGGSCGFGTPSV